MSDNWTVPENGHQLTINVNDTNPLMLYVTAVQCCIKAKVK